MRQRVSLCMIVRNEEANLPACLAGVRDLFDELVIVDTGSTDNTRALAESLGARVFDFPWCDDFSAARNVSRSHATGDWILWLDADDRIDAANRERLRQLFDQLPHADTLPRDLVFVMACRSSTCDANVSFDIAHTRLFRNRSDIAWRGRIHEHLVHGTNGVAFDNDELVFTDVMIHHEGYRNVERWAAKQRRDQRVLEREYLLHPDNAMTAFYLGRVLASQRQLTQAIPFLQRSMQLDAAGVFSSTPKAASILLKCLHESGRMSEALQTADAIRSRFPSNFELQYECGSIYLVGGRPQDAEACLRALIARSPSSPSSRSAAEQCRAGLVVGMDACSARILLAEVLCTQGRALEALHELRQLLDHDPSSLQAWAMRGELSLRCGDRNDVEITLLSLLALPNAAFEAAILKAMLCQFDRRFPEAQRWARKAIAARPNVSAGWMVLANALQEEAVDWHGCVAALEQALRLNPRLPQVRLQLQRVQAYVAALPQHQAADRRTPAAVRPGDTMVPAAVVQTNDAVFAAHDTAAWGGRA